MSHKRGTNTNLCTSVKENVVQYSGKILKLRKGWDGGKVDILHEKSDGRRLLSFFMRREGRLKEINFYQDSRSSNLVILEALEKYGVKTADILPHKKEC